jgi:prepilin-type N-terminal cleavage/methylation domain-containing protein
MKPILNQDLEQQGFSLIELAIVLFIIALLLGGLLPTLTGQLDQQHRIETRKQMEEIKGALTGFALSKGYLPCPASGVIGIEDRNSVTLQCNLDGASVRHVGILPWATLGINQTDGWGRLYRYSATPAFTTASGVFSITTPADITIKKRDPANSSLLINVTTSNDIPAVIVSPGSNGIFGTTDSGNTLSSNAPTTYNNVADQLTNVSGIIATAPLAIGRNFVTGEFAARTASNDENFDDIVVWISPNILINRMVSAGKLP